MKRVGIWLLLLVHVAGLAACGDDDVIATTSGGDGDEKQHNVVGKNTSCGDWVMEKTTCGSDMYRGEMGAIHAKDFVVANGENFMTLSGTAEDCSESSAFTETSDTPYEYRIQNIVKMSTQVIFRLILLPHSVLSGQIESNDPTPECLYPEYTIGRPWDRSAK